MINNGNESLSCQAGIAMMLVQKGSADEVRIGNLLRRLSIMNRHLDRNIIRI